MSGLAQVCVCVGSCWSSRGRWCSRCSGASRSPGAQRTLHQRPFSNYQHLHTDHSFTHTHSHTHTHTHTHSTGAELSLAPLDRTMRPRTSTPSVLMFLAALTVFSPAGLQSTITRADVLLMAMCSCAHTHTHTHQTTAHPLLDWTASPAAVTSDLMKTAIEELLDVRPLKRDRLEITVIISVEVSQSLSYICEEKPGQESFQKHIFIFMHVFGSSARFL